MIRLTAPKLCDIISESVIKTLLTESQESASIKEATRLVMDRLGYSKDQADRFIRIDLRASFPILRSKEGGKFIWGVTRMYLDRQISDATTISTLNQTLKYIVTPAHYNEYDRNLNGLSAQQLIDRFKQARTDDLEKDKAELGKAQYTEHPEYKIVRIDSFEQAKQYGRYNDWCLAQGYGEDNYDQYTSNGVNQLYFILRDGFEKEPRVKGENAPYDSYGLSMMTVIVDPEGMMTQSTTRWNHDNESSDSAFTPKQISEIIGRNFYEVFKPNTKFKDAVANALERLKMGAQVKDVFTYADSLEDGTYLVELLEKYNILTPHNTFKSQKWFDVIWSFNEGFAMVKLNGKYSFINTNGELIGNGNLWFDSVSDFDDGLARVELNRKYSFINTKGELIGNGNLWFDSVWEFDEGLARVRLNGKYSFINTKGELIGDGKAWFDDVWRFHEGLARVRLNGKYSFINTKGELIGNGNLWFDSVSDFDEEFARVTLNGKRSFINTKGELIGDGKAWFDDVWRFHEGLARVRLNGKYSFINTKGELIGNGNAWFDDVGGSMDGLRGVKLNEEFYLIKILSNNEVQFYDPETKKPIPSPLNNQNESKRKMIGLRITESQYRKLLKEMTAEEITAEAAETNTEPTEKQKEVGNYKKGHVYVKGMKISIEQPKGSIRKGTDGKGKEWKTKMSNHYGYFSRTVGKDGDHVDVFLGPDIDEFDKVFVVDQKVNGKFDESKVMLGFSDIESAKQAYMNNYNKDWKGFWKITGVPLEIFKVWLYRGRKQRQPFYQYVLIKKNRLSKKK